ncbi:MAG: hypothetical protein LBQ61_05410, partial [Spirochaetales bacterium]|nr:hypothetical protein [Spirochaetales bacterium]
SACTSSLPAFKTPDVPEQYYRISFFAYAPGTLIEHGKTSIAGHASFSIDRAGVWGFYPDKEGKLITKNGELKYSEDYPKTQEYADFFVDENIMREIMELIEEWERNPPVFIIAVNDCVSFIYRICDIIRLQYNHFTLIPITAIREIRSRNNQNEFYTR